MYTTARTDLLRIAVVTTLLLSLSAILPGRSTAQDDARTTAAARALFQEGVACSDQGDWACAVDRFGRARALRSSPVILLNYAIALGHADRVVEAAEIYRVLARDTATSADIHSEAQQAIAALEPRFAHLTVVASGPLEDIVLTLDGSALPVSAVGETLPCDPGDHVIEAHRGTEVVATARVHTDVGASAQAELTIPPAPPDVSPRITDASAGLDDPMRASEPPPSTSIVDEWWFWTILGVVVIGAGVGIGVGVAASQTNTVLPSGTLGTIDVRP